MPRLPPLAQIIWDDGSPRAVSFGDIYHSRDGGLAESEAVFLRGCGLPEAWANKDRFAVCELGFGAGVNVLAVWRAWRATRLPHAQLHISTIEAFPLARPDAARMLAQFPDVAPLAAKLLARWPVRTYAPQLLRFDEDGLTLTIHTGEAARVLAGMRANFDAWLLDGFSPARNPAMWSPEIFAHMARLSRPGARAATYTVAAAVRSGLESAGFVVEKKPGFGAKRQRLEARFAGAAPAAKVRTHYPYVARRPRRVAILGAGIAGAATAAALIKRGVETIVLDAAPELGAGASGNPAALVMPRLDRGGALSEVFLAAYLNAIATYEHLGSDVFARCGVEQRADGRNNAALADLMADPPLPDDWLRPNVGERLWHARAGAVRPRAALGALLNGAQLMLEAPIDTLQASGDGWMLRAPDGRALLKADAVVLACGAALKQFAPAQFLPLQISRGQIEWGEGAAPPHAIMQSNYVAPFDGGIVFGATFDAEATDLVRFDDPQEIPADPAARARNIAMLMRLAPEIAAGLDADKLKSRAAYRVAAPDYAPIAGALPDAQEWLAQNAAVAAGMAPVAQPIVGGIYVIGGLGARGFTLAPLLGERLAAEMFDEPHVLSQAALDAIHPARFLHRALKRGLTDRLG